MIPVGPSLSDEVVNDMAVDVGQSKISPLVAVGQLSVVNSQKMQNGRIEIMNVHRAGCPGLFGRLRKDWVSMLIRNVVPEVVRSSVADSRFDAAAGHPDGKASWVVISAVILRRQVALAVNGTTKFTAPDDERIFK